MRSSAESIDSEAPGLTGFDEAPEADESGAQQRRCFAIRIHLGNLNAESLVGDGEFGISSVTRVARELRVIAKVFHACLAIGANAASPAEPWNPDTIADIEP